MHTAAIVCGVLLILIGVVGYFGTGTTSWTALIPAFIGIPLALLGVVSGMKEDLRKHLMHAAVVIALLGFIAAAGRLGMGLSSFSGKASEISLLSTAIVCLAFVILAIRSFAAARRGSG
jgi:hypothetical protein